MEGREPFCSPMIKSVFLSLILCVWTVNLTSVCQVVFFFFPLPLDETGWLKSGVRTFPFSPMEGWIELAGIGYYFPRSVRF